MEATTDDQQPTRSEIDLTTLPRPCIAPIVFVTNGAGTVWFAVTGG